MSIIKTKKQTKFKLDMLGYHISVSDGLLEMLQYIISQSKQPIKCVQIFAGNNRASTLTAKTKYTPSQIISLKSFISKYNIHLFIHMVYVINMCNPIIPKYSYIHSNILHDLILCNSIGGKGVVIHLGTISHTNNSTSNLISNIQLILKKYIQYLSKYFSMNNITNNNNPKTMAKLILETNSGQGNQIAYSIDDFYHLYSTLIKTSHNIHHNFNIKQLLGICIDTSHIYTAGYDINKPTIMKSTILKFAKLFGGIDVIHLNDNPFSVGSKKDIHAIISTGHIFANSTGKIALKWLINYANKYKIPIILETSGASTINNNHIYSDQIKYLRSI